MAGSSLAARLETRRSILERQRMHSRGHGGRGGGDRDRGRGRGRGWGRGGRSGRTQKYNGSGRGNNAYHNGGGRGNSKGNVDHAVHMSLIESTGTSTPTSFTVAVQGCSHGELDSIYDELESYQSSTNHTIDVLLCCGDVQTLRNLDDMHCLNVPPRYKVMGDFHAYYSGRKVAPILTIVIGGNHESSNYLQELHFGGWLAPNIYYLGAAGVVSLCKSRKMPSGHAVISTLRIAGISGIYNTRHYRLGRYEVPPYNADSLRSVYHTREVDIRRLRGMSIAAGINYLGCSTQIDIMMSHDWPRGIAYHGDLPRLLQRKPFFRRDIETGELGSPANEELLNALRPRYWFAAHLHVKFEALVRHNNSAANNTGNGVIAVEQSSVDTNEIEGNRIFKQMIDSTEIRETTTEFVGLESNNGICPTSSNVETLTEQMTRFLSLDKCLPKRRHIQITHLEPSSSDVVVECDNIEPAVSLTTAGGACDKAWLEYDATWLAILRRTHEWTNPTRNVIVTDGHDEPITKDEIDDVVERVRQKNGDGCTNFGMSPLAIHQNFVMTVPPFDPSLGIRLSGTPPPMMGNPQTDILMDILGLEHRITVPYAGSGPLSSSQKQPLIESGVMRCDVTNNMNSDDTNEIDLDDDQDNVCDFVANDAESTAKCNENEIGFNAVNKLSGDRRNFTSDDVGSDAVYLSPFPDSAANEAKKARTDNS